jgi:F-type H+-transporting ATPase subunit epsilon
MAEQLFRLRVLSPLGTAFEGSVRSVTLPTPDGEITVLAHHMPMVAILADGEMRVDTGQKEVSIAIAGGFLETGAPASGVPAEPAAAAPPTSPSMAWEATVLSDFATESDSIEIARVEAAKARAELLLVERKERAEILMVERDMQRAILQLKVAEKTRTRRRRT